MQLTDDQKRLVDGFKTNYFGSSLDAEVTSLERLERDFIYLSLESLKLQRWFKGLLMVLVLGSILGWLYFGWPGLASVIVFVAIINFAVSVVTNRRITKNTLFDEELRVAANSVVTEPVWQEGIRAWKVE